MTYNSELLAIIDYRIAASVEATTAVGTVVEWTTTTAMVIFDGSALATPVKTFRGVVAGLGHRVGLIKFGRDWTIVGSFSAPPDEDQQIFNASGIWAKPYGARQVRVMVQGGGGAGGGAQTASSAQHSCGSGGGGGAYAETLFDADDLPDSVTVQIGAGGTGVNANNGNNGGTSRFGVSAEGGPFVGAGGGYGGKMAGDSSASFGKEGGEGGDTWEGTGDIQIKGSPGHACFGGGSLGIGGAGGSSQLGAGAVGTSFTSSPNAAAGVAADTPGGGGGGALTCSGGTAKAGGAGSKGQVIVITTF